jgi:hypothetical protein
MHVSNESVREVVEATEPSGPAALELAHGEPGGENCLLSGTRGRCTVAAITRTGFSTDATVSLG